MVYKLENSARVGLQYFGLLLIMLLATYLRFKLIESQSLWYDEGNSAKMIFRSANEIVLASAADVHPPGYYLLLKVWSGMTGGSEFALRSLSAFAGLVAVSGMYLIGKQIGNYVVGSLAAVLGSIHPGLVYYSQEVRMYMVCTLLSVVLVYTSIRLRDEIKTNDVALISIWRILFVLCGVAGLYVHYSFGFILVAINCACGYEIIISDRETRKRHVLLFVCLQVGIVVLYIPWLSTAIEHLVYWPAAKVSLSTEYAAWELWSWLAFGPTVEVADNVLGLVCLGSVGVIGLASGRSRMIWIATWMIAPVSLILAFGLFSEAFEKFLVLAVPAVVIIAAGGFERLIRLSYIPGRMLSLIAFAVVISSTYLSLDNLYHNEYYWRDNYRLLVADMLYKHREGDAVLLNAPNQAEVISYYYPSMENVFQVAQTRPFDPQKQIMELEAIADGYSRIIGVFWGEKQADPEVVVETWLNSHTFKTAESWYGQIRVATYDVAEEGYMEDIYGNFGDVIRLERYGINSREFSPEDVVQITLDWSASREISTRYKIFIHIYDDINLPPVAQNDSEPVGGSMPTNLWANSEIITDMHGIYLPANVKEGIYTLAVGIYALDGGERLTVVGEQDMADRIVLGKIAIVE